MIIQLERISLNFGEQKIFDNFSLTLGAESPAVFLGPSGCGKTTLLKIIAALIKPVSGTVSFFAEAPGGAPVEAVRKSFMFQEPRLLPWLSILDNVMLPMQKALPKNECKARAECFLELVSLTPKKDIFPEKLSGGEKQRASMARAFTYEAPLLLLDEPFQSLDIPLRIALMDTLHALLQKDKRTCIVVTHDPREALYMGSRIIVLNRSAAGSGVVLDERGKKTQGKLDYVNRDIIEQEQRLIAALGESAS